MWEIFEKLCKERGVTPYRVGEATGIKTSSLSAWKNGRYKFKMDKLMKIAEFFDVSVEYLMTGEEREEREPSYYIDPDTAKIAQEIYANQNLRLLFDASKNATPEQLKLLQQMALSWKVSND